MLGPFNDSTKHIETHQVLFNFVNRVNPCQSISTTLKTKQNMTNWTSLLTAVGRLTFHLGHGCLSRQHVGMIGLWSTLRYSNITMENPPFVNEFPIGTGGISIATMLDYWRKILFELCCYKVLGRSWFSSLRSTHTHTHTHKDTNKSRQPWPFLLHIATNVSVFLVFFGTIHWTPQVDPKEPYQVVICRPFFSPLNLLRIII